MLAAKSILLLEAISSFITIPYSYTTQSYKVYFEKKNKIMISNSKILKHSF